MSNIKTYLEQIVAWHKNSDHPGQRAHADKSQHAFVLRHGRDMTFGRTQISGPIKQCYSNATDLAMTDADLTYCEGYTTSCGIPIEHAWCIDRDGRVIETTIRDHDEKREYYGVSIQKGYLLKTLFKKKTHQFFDWMHPEAWVNVDPAEIVADEIAEAAA